MTLMLASSARVIENDKQTLLLDLESRKWIRMTTEGFRAVKAVLDRSSAATDEQISGLSGNVVRNTIEHLQQNKIMAVAKHCPGLGKTDVEMDTSAEPPFAVQIPDSTNGFRHCDFH